MQNTLPENHALYGVTTHAHKKNNDRGLLPSLVSFMLPPNPDSNPPGDRQIVGELNFQSGPINEVGVNGIGIEHLLHVVADRLRGYQDTEFACRENDMALAKVEEALHWLLARTLDRQRRGVEGTRKR